MAATTSVASVASLNAAAWQRVSNVAGSPQVIEVLWEGFPLYRYVRQGLEALKKIALVRPSYLSAKLEGKWANHSW